ncbi:MAG: VCBS repeat-containing protein, partial [Acidobacteria bacterium]|nr:VCBS repeat-containing protein [Acidobacteriota bacterium]
PLARIEAGQWGAFSVGDFTGDGNPDIAFNDDFSDTVQILAGKGDGAFEPAAALAPGGAIALAAADFNGDGIQDLAALRASGITVYAGSRTAITESGRYETLAAALHLLTGDFDGDSRPDLIAGTGGQLGLLLNTGAGSFRPVPVSAGSLNFWRTTPMAIADFDRDGKDDIVITAGYYRLEGGLGPGLVLMSNGDGSFQRLELPLARGTVALAVEDWDEDGNPDILLLNGITGAVTIMRNER